MIPRAPHPSRGRKPAGTPGAGAALALALALALPACGRGPDEAVARVDGLAIENPARSPLPPGLAPSTIAVADTVSHVLAIASALRRRELDALAAAGGGAAPAAPLAGPELRAALDGAIVSLEFRLRPRELPPDRRADLTTRLARLEALRADPGATNDDLRRALGAAGALDTPAGGLAARRALQRSLDAALFAEHGGRVVRRRMADAPHREMVIPIDAYRAWFGEMEAAGRLAYLDRGFERRVDRLLQALPSDEALEDPAAFYAEPTGTSSRGAGAPAPAPAGG
jgi:hypothetical protein